MGEPRITAELQLDLDHIRGGLVFGVDRSHVKDAIAAMDRVEAELVAVRERAERLERKLAAHHEQGYDKCSACLHFDLSVAEQEKEQEDE